MNDRAPEPVAPSDNDFRVLGFTEEQIKHLEGEPNWVREYVYEVVIRIIMESSEDGCDIDGLLGHI